MLRSSGVKPLHTATFNPFLSGRPVFNRVPISPSARQPASLPNASVGMLALFSLLATWLGKEKPSSGNAPPHLKLLTAEVATPMPLHVVKPRYKIMSYNAENFYKKHNGDLVKPLASVQALADAILREDPDVIALQEVGDAVLLADFNQRYLQGQYPNIVSFPARQGEILRVAMMSKANIKVKQAKSHWDEMSKNVAYQGRRDFLEATFETPNGYRFTVYNAHCKSMRGGEKETLPIRLQEAANIVDILKSRLKKRDGNAQVIVAGDFNTLPDTVEGKKVLETLTHIRSGHKLVDVIAKDGPIDPTHNGYGVNPNAKLDYMFMPWSMASKQVVSSYVAGAFDEEPWRSASDHLPCVTVFEEPALQKASAAHSPTKPAPKRYKPLDLTA